MELDGGFSPQILTRYGASTPAYDRIRDDSART
jgi:hypothetical protein